MRTILTLFVALSLCSTAQAQNLNETLVLQTAIEVRDQFITAMQKKDFSEFAEQGMNSAIQELSTQLRNQYQDPASAVELEQTWKEATVDFQAQLMFAAQWRDLGDHAPLIPKLEDFLIQLSKKYGRVILSLPIIPELRMMNYALPVVFSPKGVWKSGFTTEGARIEYRKHFIPFANFVTYYASLFTCNYLVDKNHQPQLKRLCKPAAEKLKFAMGRYVAPAISDWIYSASNRTIRFNERQIGYTKPEQLKRAIQ